MEAAGARGWPVLGAVYMVEAVKRVRGMRLVGLARRQTAAKRAATAVVANRGVPPAWRQALTPQTLVAQPEEPDFHER